MSSYVSFFLPSASRVSFSFLETWMVVISLFSTIFPIVNIVRYLSFSLLHNSMVNIVTIAIIIIGIVVSYWQYRKNKQLHQYVQDLQSQVKSQQVKYGKSFEHFIPFIQDFPADREKTVFLGMPLDFIAFEEDAVKFIEVKTGQSQLSPKQKQIKHLIKERKVEWYELRYE